MANAHSRSNLLTKVRVNGALLAEVDDIKDRVCRAFHTLLAKSRDWRLTMRVLCFKVLGRESSSILEGLSWRRKFWMLSIAFVGKRLQAQMVLLWHSSNFDGILSGPRSWIVLGSSSPMALFKQA